MQKQIDDSSTARPECAGCAWSRLDVQAGVGVVADSDLEAEYQESVQKARALVRAADEAVRFASAGQWSAGNTRR